MTNATGSVLGRVVDSAALSPIVNASVTLTLVSGGIAGAVPTNTTGGFRIDASPGVYALGVSAANYSNNTTQVQVHAGLTSDLGTLRLVEDGFVVGVVRASDPSHEPILNATLNAASRNRLLTVPAARSSANGSFHIAVPPTTDLLTVGPPPGLEGEFASNFTFVAPGSGRTVDIGTFYLIEGTKLDLTIRDRVTHARIGPNFTSEVFTCSKITGDCPFHSSGGRGPSIPVWALPGPTILHVLVVGYIVNVTPIATVPSLAAGTTVSLEANVSPLGVVQVTPGVTGGMPAVGGNYIPTSRCYDARFHHPGGPFWIDCQTQDTNISGLAVCSLTGLEVAVPTHDGIMPTPCFPSIVNRFGVAGLFLGPPLRDYIELGSFLGVAPMFRNESWVNLTSDRVTNAGNLNFTSGGYVAGHVYLGHTKTPPVSYTLRACSTDETWICGPSQSFPRSANSSYPIDGTNASSVGCPTDAGAFCIAAPPGPVRIEANGAGASRANWTWFEVPHRCCVASPHILWIRNLTGGTAIELPVVNASVFGRIVGAPGGIEPPLSGASVRVCPTEYGNPAPCENPVSLSNLAFQVPAPLGWDSVEVQALAYVTNRTWLDVTGRNDSGTIVLDPLAIVEGRVVDARGIGILGAALDFCPVSAPGLLQPGCQALVSPSQTEVTGSGGYYSGYLPGGPYPSATYMLSASAGGYIDNWTWVNATPGALIAAPTVTLGAVGPSPPSLSTGPRAAASSPGVWIEGRLVDGRTGQGVVNADLTACLTTGSHTCTVLGDYTNWGGSFNQSVARGPYWLNASKPGYVSASFYVNATGSATVRLGILPITPEPWLSGRVVIGTWPSLTFSGGLGPAGGSVTACSSTGSVCGQTGVLSTSGFFNVSAPAGSYDSLGIQANGGSPFDSWAQVQAEGSGFGGFDPLTIAVNVSSPGTALATSGAAAPALAIFGYLTGSVWDGTSWNSTLHRPTAPVAWASLVATGRTPGDTANMPLDGGGRFFLFCSGGTKLRLDLSGSAFWHVNNSSVQAPASGSGGAVAPFDLAHYGWITATARDGAGHAIPFAGLNASIADPVNKTRISTSDTANGAGYVNLSAPPGTNVTLQASAPGHRNASASGAVLSRRTSPFSLPPLMASPTAFFLASAQINTVGGPPTPSLVDPISGLPVAAATIALRSASGAVGYTSSNGIGEFLLSAPVAATCGFTIDRTGYVPVTGSTNGSAGFHQLGVVDLIGDGIAAGRVVGEPGGQGVSGAYVSALDPTSGSSVYTITNGDGEFWLEAPPGNFSLTIQAASFTSNRSYGAVVVSDGFTRVGDLPVYADSRVSGNVLGRPFLTPIAGANVTLCPLNGSFSDYCPFPTPTDALGGFSLAVPFGVYRLTVNATGFGQWSIELELLPGEMLALGKILLDRDGGIFGVVVDAKTSLPIAGASVLACPVGPGPCAGPVATDPTGFYLLVNVTPGAEEVRASALGYSIVSTLVEVPGGSTVQAPVIDLWPIGVLPTFALKGRVVWNGSGTPIGGARVAAVEVTNGFQAVGLSNPNGTFALLVPSGNYRLTASAPGARPAVLSITVRNASVGGILAALEPNLFVVKGTVAGEGTHRPVAGASVRWGSAGVAITGPNGGFSVNLANGTYELSATPVLAPSATEFGVARLTIVVDGRAQWANVTLPANLRITEVRAVDALTGLGIPSASGTLAGTSAFGLAVSITFAMDPNGSFAVNLPDGRYLVRVNASGYGAGTADLAINGSTASAVLVLSPVGAPQGPGLSLGPWWTAPLLAGAAVILVASIWFRLRGRRPRDVAAMPDASPELAEPTGTVEPEPYDAAF